MILKNITKDIITYSEDLYDYSNITDSYHNYLNECRRITNSNVKKLISDTLIKLQATKNDLLYTPISEDDIYSNIGNKLNVMLSKLSICNACRSICWHLSWPNGNTMVIP